MIPKIAIIIPWFGKDLKGGAEQHAWQIATRLAFAGVSVTVLTTCSKEFLSDWSRNHYKPGEYSEAGLSIKRFPLSKRNVVLFDRVNALLQGLDKKNLSTAISPLRNVEEAIFLDENINSPDLLAYIAANKDDFDAFIFLPYLFTSTIQGVMIAKDKAILLPCLHDESYAYLESVKQSFKSAGRIFFISEGEYALAVKLYGESLCAKSVVAGAGVEISALSSGYEDRGRIVEGRYLLCLGRKDTGKNTHLLVEAFDRYLEKTGSTLKLVLAGPAALPVKPISGQIIDLGLVSDEGKHNLLKYCLVVVNPSENESFSRVIFEAWLMRKPVAIHRNCLATFKALEKSDFAGWHADSQDEFIVVFEQIENASHDTLLELGSKGCLYAQDVAVWDKVIDNYLQAIRDMIDANSINVGHKNEQDKTEIYSNIAIMYHNIYIGDAVGNDIVKQKDLLESQGIKVNIFAEQYDERLKCNKIRKDKLAEFIKNENNTIIYHHANYWQYGEEILFNARCKVVMKYHNITPADFFEKYQPEISRMCAAGREQTGRLVQSGCFVRYLADSEYNAAELVEYGVDRALIDVVAPFHRINDFLSASTNTDLLEQMYNEELNLLFVGRVAPHKGCHHLIEIVSEYVKHFDRNVFLNIVGGVDPQLIKYVDELNNMIREYGLEDVIAFRQHVSFDELNTYYRASDIFLLMSEHEGFCLPILEAQSHRLPVIALDRAAVKYTLGEEQMLFSGIDYFEIATAIHVICENRGIYNYLSDKGLENYLQYDECLLFKKIMCAVSKINISL